MMAMVLFVDDDSPGWGKDRGGGLDTLWITVFLESLGI